MKYKTLTRSRKTKSIEREVRRIFKKITRDYQGIRRKKLLFGKEG